LKAEIEVAKGAAHTEMEKCKTITESRFEVLKTENDRLETLIQRWRDMHAKSVEEKLRGDKHCDCLGGELRSMTGITNALRNEVKGAIRKGVRTEKNLRDRLDAAERSSADALEEVSVLTKATTKLEKKTNEFKAARTKMYNAREYSKRKIEVLERKIIMKPSALDSSKQRRTRVVEPAEIQKRTRVASLITFRDPKAKRTDGRARFTAAAHHATSSVNQAAGFISNRYSQMQEAESRHMFVGPEDPNRIDTHRGGLQCLSLRRRGRHSAVIEGNGFGGEQGHVFIG
jgi:hypothetical protein